MFTTCSRFLSRAVALNKLLLLSHDTRRGFFLPQKIRSSGKKQEKSFLTRRYQNRFVSPGEAQPTYLSQSISNTIGLVNWCIRFLFGSQYRKRSNTLNTTLDCRTPMRYNAPVTIPGGVMAAQLALNQLVRVRILAWEPSALRNCEPLYGAVRPTYSFIPES